MGAIGSGSRGTRARYENLCPVDLTKIERDKPPPGLWRKATWKFGANTHPSDITAWSPIENFGFRLQHIGFNPDGSTSKAEAVVGYAVTRQSAAHPIEQLAYSPRRWFCCPGCHRACRIVYGKAGFRCRLCIRNGIYASQAVSRRWRAVQRMQRMRQRLGGSADLSKPFPRKPRTMHWSKYRKLAARDGHDFNRISFR